MAYAYLDEDFDPWEHVEDIDGNAHYKVLEISTRATSDDVRVAYRRLIRVHHPDKGGNAEKFAAIQKAWEVLSDPQARQTYDDWAKELKFRYIPGVTAKAPGGEDVLLDEFERLGLSCDPKRQLVVLCEVCGRPSTKVCWICELRFCDFCTRKQHWKGKHGLHWPMVNSPHMRDQIAKKELEKKRIEDAKRLALEDPNFREEHELRDLRQFKKDAQSHFQKPNSQVTYDLQLSKYYMWAQTARFVYIAVMIPTGYEDKELRFEPSAHDLKLQPEDSPPVIHRLWAYEVDTNSPIETFKTKNNRLMTAAVPKKNTEHWQQVFKGDSSGARCVQQPYILKETHDDVVMEIELPFWIDKDDCGVDITSKGVVVEVRNQIKLERSFWRDESEASKSGYLGVVDVDECIWSLDEELENGERKKVLMITFIKPPLSDDEKMWKKGKRMDNRNKDRHDGMSRKGYRFFKDDEDVYGLEDHLIALSFLESGEAWIPAKPWSQYHYPYENSKLAKKVSDLNEGAKKHLENLLEDGDADSDVSDERQRLGEDSSDDCSEDD